jgi:hypothetical protein
LAVFIGEPGFAERDERFAERALDPIDPVGTGPTNGSAHQLCLWRRFASAF